MNCSGLTVVRKWRSPTDIHHITLTELININIRGDNGNDRTIGIQKGRTERGNRLEDNSQE
jgi:hypothetical protein